MTFRYDPLAPDFQDRRSEVYRTMRDEHPAYHDPVVDQWVLTRYDDVLDACRDWETFSNDHVAEAASLLPMMIYMDAPRHTALRAIVSRAFTPKRVADLEPRIRAVASELVGELAVDGGGDVVDELAGPLPARVMGELLGIPREQIDEFRAWTDKLLTTTSPEESGEIGGRVYGLFAGLLEERRRSPADDLMSALLAAEVDGARLTDDELLGFCFLLVLAGNDTTTSLIGNGSALLARHPDERALLVDDPALIPNAVEEMLRVDAPTQVLPRTAMRDVDKHGEVIPAGARVMVCFGAGNLDERAFPDPDRFDVRRRFDRHLAFGHGPHFCLGAALARLEATIAFEELLRQVPAFELAAEPVRVRSSWARAYESVPISA